MRATSILVCVLLFASLPGWASAQDAGLQPNRKPVDVMLKGVDSSVKLKVDPGNPVPVALSGEPVVKVKAADAAGVKVDDTTPIKVSVAQSAPIVNPRNGYLSGVDVRTEIKEVELHFAGDSEPIKYTLDSRRASGVPCIAGDWIFVAKQSIWTGTVEIQDWRPLSEIRKIVVQRYAPSQGRPSLSSLDCGQ